MPIQPAYLTRPFAPWLLRQHKRGGDIGRLARAARKDPGFPKQGDWWQVQAHIARHEADTDPVATADAALTEWRDLGCP